MQNWSQGVVVARQRTDLPTQVPTRCPGRFGVLRFNLGKNKGSRKSREVYTLGDAKRREIVAIVFSLEGLSGYM